MKDYRRKDEGRHFYDQDSNDRPDFNDYQNSYSDYDEEERQDDKQADYPDEDPHLSRTESVKQAEEDDAEEKRRRLGKKLNKAIFILILLIILLFLFMRFVNF